MTLLDLPPEILIAFAAIFIGTGVLLVVLDKFDTDDAIAFANAEHLRAAISEACITDASKDSPVSLDFNVHQNKPFNQLRTPVISTPKMWYLVKFRIRTDGDPKYVLYSELFPPGEGIGWETFHEFGYRAVIMVDSPSRLTTGTLEHIVNRVKETVSITYHSESPDVLVANILPTERVDLTKGTSIEKRNKPLTQVSGNGEFAPGTWTDDDSFEFTDYYTGLSAAQKTFIKYESCGDGRLCFKTRSGVQAKQLDPACGSRYIQFVNADQRDARRDAKYGDLNLASPCKGKARVYLDDCRTKMDGTFVFSGSSFSVNLDDFGKCKRSISYPLYVFDGADAFIRKGSHTSCLDGISSSAPENTEPLPCIRVVFDQKDDFCSTTNPNGEAMPSIIDYLKRTVLVPDITINRISGSVRSVAASTDYFSMDVDGATVHVYVLKPHAFDESKFSQLENVLGKKSWAWPE